MNRFVKTAALAVLGFAAATNSAEALTTVTTTFAVSATVSNGCAISATALAFGAYDSSSATPLDATTAVTVLCTVGTPYNVGLNAGTGSGASVTTRKLTGSVAGTLNYTLYSDSGRTTVWGNTVGTNTVSGTYAIGQLPLTVYGRVATGQNVLSGSYTDTITVSITY